MSDRADPQKELLNRLVFRALECVDFVPKIGLVFKVKFSN